MRPKPARLTGVHIARLIECSVDTAGEYVIDRAAVLKRVGNTAWVVYEALCRLRTAVDQRYGMVRALRATIAAWATPRGATPLSLPATKRALATLKAAGLVEATGWYPGNVTPGGKAASEAKLVFWHRVRGQLLIGGSDELGALMAVPEATAEWFVKAPGRGGARAGTGPKRPQEDTVESDSKPGRGIQSRAGVPIQSRADNGPLSYVPVKHPETCSKEQVSPRAQERRVVGSSPSSKSTEEVTALGTVLGSSAPPRHLTLVSRIGGDVPPYPGFSVVTPAMVPAPPLLKPEMGAVALVEELARWYRGAVSKVFGERCFVLMKGVKRSKHYAKMLEFAERLIAHEIPPAVWCLYACEEWKGIAPVPGSKRPHLPPLQVVFNPNRLETSHRWKFRDQWGDGQIGGRTVFTDSHRELITRYQRMHSAITQGTTRADAVERYFPDGLYDKLIDRTKVEALATRKVLETQIAKGVFVW